MNKHKRANSDKEVLNLTLRTAHVVTGNDPKQAYKDMGRPMLPDLPVAFLGYAPRVAGLTDDERYEIGNLLSNGLSAVSTVVSRTLLQTPDIIRKKEALRIATSDGTVQTLSVVALQSANTAFELLEQARSPHSPFIVDRPSQSVRFVHPDYHSVSSGPYVCTGALLKDGETISPVFRDFVRWSGAVAIHSMYKRRLSNSGG